jgi:PHD/YefM family antitoxin component YafN of YafNO toxin-antitoxin module
MEAIKPRFVVDEAGQPVGVLLDIEEYRQLLEEIEELDEIRAYDAATTSDDEAIPFEQAVAEIEGKQKR